MVHTVSTPSGSENSEESNVSNLTFMSPPTSPEVKPIRFRAPKREWALLEEHLESKTSAKQKYFGNYKYYQTIRGQKGGFVSRF